jgi:hypothetical protein
MADERVHERDGDQPLEGAARERLRELERDETRGVKDEDDGADLERAEPEQKSRCAETLSGRVTGTAVLHPGTTHRLTRC